jgi:RNA polymerase sigma-70 factor
MGREVLARLCAGARRVRPELGSVSEGELEVFITARVPDDRLDEHVRAEDLLLVCACTKGARAAHDAVHAMSGDDIDRAHARIRPPLTQAQARQTVWNRLLQIPAGGAARIALYKGETELAAWLRAFANRFFLGLVSQPKTAPLTLHDAILLHSAGNASLNLDPELTRVKQSYAPGLRATLGHTLTSLDARERALLHDAIVERDDLTSLSLMYAMTRESLVSVLDGARAKLEYRVKNRLAERMKISDRDHASLVRCLGIQLDAALSRTTDS